MVLLHKISGEKKTFGDLAEITLVSALNYATNSDRIDIIIAVYKGISIDWSRMKRENKGLSRMGFWTTLFWTEDIAMGINPWMSLCKNTYQVTIWWMDERPSYLMKLSDITYQEDFVKIDREGTLTVLELASSKEEADTWILLHAKHAHETIIVVSDDTAAIILALTLFRQIGPIYGRCWNNDRIKCINSSKLGKSHLWEPPDATACHNWMGRF